MIINLLEKNSDLRKPHPLKAPVFFHMWDLKNCAVKLGVLSGRDESRHTAQDLSRFSMFQLRFLVNCRQKSLLKQDIILCMTFI